MAFKAGDVFVQVGAQFDNTGFQRFERAAQDAENKARRSKIEAALGADFDERGFKAYERAIDQAAAKARRKELFKVELGADFDGRAFAAYEREVAKAERASARLNTSNRDLRGSSRDANVGIRDLAVSMRGLFDTAGKITTLGIAAQGLSALSAGAVAAASSLSSLAGIMATLPSFASAFGQALGTGGLGFMGIADAIKATTDAQAAAGTTAAKSATQQATAARQIENAQEGVRSARERVRQATQGVEQAERSLVGAHRDTQAAEERLADAQRESLRAQEELNQARLDARRRLEDMHESASDVARDERRAVLDLAEARQKLAEVQADPEATSLDRQRAVLALADAEDRLSDVQRDRARLGQDLAKADKDGVRGSREVVDAQRRVADSARGVRDATRDVADARLSEKDAARAVTEANRQVTEAQRGVQRALRDVQEAQQAATDKVNQGVSATNKLAEAMSKLSPAGREFVRFLTDLQPKLKELQAASQQGLLPGVERGITSAMRNFDVLREGISRTAKVMGDLVEQAGKLVGSQGFGRDLETQMRRNDTTIRRTGEGSLHLANALRNITIAAGPLVDWITRSTLRFTELIDRQARAGRESGALARFFDETRVAMSRVIRIAGDVAVALFNISRAGKPLGDDLLVSLTKNADKFREWTESARGRNDIAEYFKQARAPIYELSKLIEDVTKTFFRLGQGDQVAPLIRQIRMELLPVLENVVGNTTRAFGPAFIRFLVEASKAFSVFAGASGPLVAFTNALTAILRLFNRLVDRVPALGTALATLAAVGGIAKALGIASAITGIGRVNTLLRGTAVAGAAAGAAPTAAGAGGLLGWLNRLPGPIRAVTLALAAVGGIKIAQGFSQLGEHAKQVAKNMDSFRESANRAGKSGDPARMRRAAEELRTIGRYAKGAIPELDLMARGLDRSARRAEAMARTVRETNRTVSTQWRSMRITTDSNLADIRRFVDATTATIKERLSSRTAEGRKALSDNFKRAADAVREHMDRAGKTTASGTAEIRSLMIRAFKAMGLNTTQAQAIAEHGTLQSSGNRVPGQAGQPGQRGGTAAMIAAGKRGVKREGGGWIGAPGMVGQDTVPAMLAPGEAVLNRHQQAVVEGLLGGGFLDKLFATVDKPHYMAKGGKVQKFATGGIVQLGRSLQSQGFQVSEHPAFGGVHPVHVPNSYHYRAGALDVNWSPAGQEPAKMDALSARLRAAGWHVLWRVPGHFDHLHVDVAGGGGSSLGPGGEINPPKIRAPRTGIRGSVGAMVQRALDLATAGGNAQIRRAAEQANVDRDPRHPASPQPGSADVVSAFRRAATTFRASPVEKLALFEAGIVESGLRNLSYGDRDSVGALQQRPSQGWHGLMNPYAAAIEFLQHARRLAPWRGSAGQLAQAVQRSAFPGRYDAARGEAMRFMARGGFAGRALKFATGGRVHPLQGQAALDAGWAGPAFYAATGKRTTFNDTGYKKSLAPYHIEGLQRLQASRVGAFENVQREVQSLQNQYSVQERAYNMTDEQPLNDDGSLNLRSIFIRVVELNKLIEVAGQIFAAVQRAKDVAARILWSMGTILGRLRSSLWVAAKHGRPMSERQGIVGQIEKYEGEFSQWRDTLDTLAQVDAPNRLLDIAALVQERDAVAGTQAQPNVDQAIPPIADTPIDSGVGSDVGGGGAGTGDVGGGNTAEKQLADQQAAAAAREQELTQVAERAERLRANAAANLGVAQGNLRALGGPGDIGFGAQNAFKAAWFGGTPAMSGIGPASSIPGVGGQVTVVQNFQSLAPPTGTQAVQIGQAATAAISSLPYRTSTTTVLK